MYTQNEMNAVLEEAAQKLGITLEGLKLAVWQQEEDDGLRSDIKQYLDEEGLTYTEEDVDLIFDEVNTDRGEDTRMRIEVAFQQSGVELEPAELDDSIVNDDYVFTANDLKVDFDAVQRAAGYLTGTIELNGESLRFTFNEETKDIDIKAYIDVDDIEESMCIAIQSAIEKYNTITVSDLEIDDQWVGGTITFKGETCSFDYNTKTNEIWSTKEFSEELKEFLEEDMSPVHDAVNQYLYDIGFFSPCVSNAEYDPIDEVVTGTIVYGNESDTFDFNLALNDWTCELPAPGNITLEAWTDMLDEIIRPAVDEAMEKYEELAQEDEIDAEEQPRSNLDSLIAEAGEPAANTNTESRNKEADAR